MDGAKNCSLGFPKVSGTFVRPQTKGYDILGSILGFPYLGALPFKAERLGCGNQGLLGVVFRAYRPAKELKS